MWWLLVAALTLPPKPDRYVTDRAGVLATTRAAALNEKLAQFERTTSDQILVYIDQHLPPDTSIEEMGAEAIRKWGVGQKGKDNGAILFVFIADRKMRIEVGYGLEGSLTDAKSSRIINQVIKPEFQRGNFPDGIANGVDAMIATIRGEPYHGSGQTVAETHAEPLSAVMGLFIIPLLIATVLHLRTGFRIAGRLAGRKPMSKSAWFVAIAPATTIFILVIVVAMISPDDGPVAGVAAFFFLGVSLVLGFVAGLVSAAVSRLIPSGVTFGPTSSWSSSSSHSSWSSSSSSSSFSSSSSSSSFSGGGGSGGGGGASGSW
jgi:uncharacterized protein